VGVLMCGALLGLMFAANEASKESHIKAGVMVDLSGETAQMKLESSFITLLDVPKLSETQLDELKSVSFSAYRLSDREGGTPLSKEQSLENFGVFSLRFDVQGYVKSSHAVTLETPKGSIIIPTSATAPNVTHGGINYQIIVTSPSRRLSEEHGEQARAYRSVDELMANEARHGNHMMATQSGSKPSRRLPRRLQNLGVAGATPQDECSPFGSLKDNPLCTQKYCDQYLPGNGMHYRCDPNSVDHHWALKECKATCGLHQDEDFQAQAPKAHATATLTLPATAKTATAKTASAKTASALQQSEKFLQQCASALQQCNNNCMDMESIMMDE